MQLTPLHYTFIRRCVYLGFILVALGCRIVYLITQ